MQRSHDRDAYTTRELIFETGFQRHPAGSVLVSWGDTRVLVAVSVEDKVPPFRVDSGLGWLTAEYAMLPGSTNTRKRRDGVKQDGRSVEIQRLIGRSLRAAVDMEKLGQRTLRIDCDVIDADGSTRCASITAGTVALGLALRRLGDMGLVPRLEQVMPAPVAAVSVGIVDGEVLVDLDQREDNRAEVDMNIVATHDGRLIEVQGTAEGAPFDRDRANIMIDKALASIQNIAELQRRAWEVSA